MPSDRTEHIALGHIGGAHGIRGEVVLKPYTEQPLDIAAYGPLSEQGGSRIFTITKARVVKNGVVARLEGIDDRNQAEALKGVVLTVARDQLPEPDAEDEWYQSDLIGLAVYDKTGHHIGEVVAMPNYGASDLVEIRPVGEVKTFLLPFSADYVPEIDIAAGRVVVELPEGYLD